MTFEKFKALVLERKQSVIIPGPLFKHYRKHVTAPLLSPHIAREHFLVGSYAVINGGWAHTPPSCFQKEYTPPVTQVSLGQVEREAKKQNNINFDYAVSKGLLKNPVSNEEPRIQLGAKNAKEEKVK